MLRKTIQSKEQIQHQIQHVVFLYKQASDHLERVPYSLLFFVLKKVYKDKKVMKLAHQKTIEALKELRKTIGDIKKVEKIYKLKEILDVVIKMQKSLENLHSFMTEVFEKTAKFVEVFNTYAKKIDVLKNGNKISSSQREQIGKSSSQREQIGKFCRRMKKRVDSVLTGHECLQEIIILCNSCETLSDAGNISLDDLKKSYELGTGEAKKIVGDYRDCFNKKILSRIAMATNTHPDKLDQEVQALIIRHLS